MKRWEIRDEFKEEIGDAFYAMAMYEQTKRFTMKMGKGLLCISTEIDVDNDEIVMKVLNETSKVL
ncbi:hypothetical protein NKOR_07480 [Candidatus Nitrosopumilus koreensis AR1]|uniref:Uncharacterized protein n=1 Tax=Candidatus Nitrosopumilus koreensis AR1 TaxID=1229908 RepID=K0B8D3_9ARCH|nr:hypothetical protein [Candidatus Nitrosopumilus koreensis]AFS81357.1 hypothetical protein NKOR_07480 [Candidatus Nitrosopumilus koreensis AR1]